MLINVNCKKTTMKRNSILLIILSFFVLGTGCKKYVDIKTQGNLVPGETLNYRYLLNDNNTFAFSVRGIDIPSDDIYIADSAQMADIQNSSTLQYYQRTYTWQPSIYILSGESDPDWDRLYKTIYNANVIITEVGKSTGGTDSAKNEISAEAKVHRAEAYLMLVNMYAKPYSNTASADLGVPLLTAPTVTEALTRAPLAKVFEQILEDLQSSTKYLPTKNQFNTLPSKAAAYALLARTNLYMANYQQAGAWADSALAIQSTLNDLAALTASSYPRTLADPELIFSKSAAQSNAYGQTAFRLSDSLLSLLGTADLRYSLFTAPGNTVNTNYTGRFFSKERIGNFETRNYGPTVPEMMLIKAETLARNGNVSDAMTLVNNLRKKRFTAAGYTPVTATTQQEALVQVIKERQREFFCRGLRWFDMRRLKSDPMFAQTLTRRFLNNTYTLAPNSDRYVFPIADYYRTFNPGIQANP